MNVADAAVVELIPSLGERLLAELCAVAGIPVVHERTIRDSGENFGGFGSSADVARVLVFEQKSDALLAGDFDRFTELFDDAVLNGGRISHAQKSEDAQPICAERMSRAGGTLQIVQL